ncbi:hypothetical protein WM32_09350 [Burkholderia ubonensis]|nr:hypothetical protein WM32_09350 [Burkholderia ubonensis]
MHWAAGRIAWQRHSAEQRADRLQGLFFRFIQKRRYFLDMSCDQQESLAGLSKAAQFTAVVSRFRHGIPIAAQHIDNLVEQVSAPGGNAGDVLEYDQLDRIVDVRFKSQPDAT